MPLDLLNGGPTAGAQLAEENQNMRLDLANAIILIEALIHQRDALERVVAACPTCREILNAKAAAPPAAPEGQAPHEEVRQTPDETIPPNEAVPTVLD